MRHIAIIGGGFSGALLGINLLRHEGPRATLIERTPAAGRGTAYGTLHDGHLLNVRAANMSAFPDDKAHFARWLADAARGGPDSFAPRRTYGDYLEELLRAAAAAAPERLALVRGEAVDLHEHGGDGAEIVLADGARIRADAVALAIGNLAPSPPPGIDAARLGADVYVPDPWRGDLAAGLARDDRLLVIGTGLTMIDVALLLEARGFAGSVLALSRRGLLPHGHAPVTMPPPPPERPPVAPAALLAAVRARADAVSWRAAVDELRPVTQDLWRAMTLDERRRFLRHLRPWWDAHRHRIAPEVAARIAAMRGDGRLAVAAGRIVAVEPAGGGARVTIRRRGADAAETITVRRIVNATGPQGDVRRTDEPLLRALHARGRIRADPLGIGIDVDRESRAIAADGTASDALMVLGPMTRGEFWEIVAVPDIRRQVWSVARRLSNAHWVEGEGL